MLLTVFLLEKNAVLESKHMLTVNFPHGQESGEMLSVNMKPSEFVAYLGAHFSVLGVREPLRLFDYLKTILKCVSLDKAEHAH